MKLPVNLSSLYGVIASAAILTGTAMGNVIHVPADFPTIQEAIVAAVDGDAILVDPGTYTESIDFLGKAISVSAVDPDPAQTVIVAAASAPAALFQSGESSSARLAGFTLTGGSGVSVGGTIVGGNLFVSGASPTLEHLVIRDNLAGSAGGGAWFSSSSALLDGVVFFQCHASNGGGLQAVDSSLVISGCRFDTCKVDGSGGGLDFESCPSLTIRDSVIVGNQASYAGGLYATQTHLEVSACTFDQNLADENSGGGMSLADCSGLVTTSTFTHNSALLGIGGGIHIWGDSPVTIVDCDFDSNWAVPDGSHIGVENLGISSGPTITACRGSGSDSAVTVVGSALVEHADFVGFTHHFGDFGISVSGAGARLVDVSVHGFDAGVLFYATSHASLQRCRVTDNYYSAFEAYDGGGLVEDCQLTGSWVGAWCENATILFDGCTITRNSNPGNYPGGLKAVGPSAPTLRNSIVHGNVPIEIDDATGGLLDVEYCDVAGGWPGTGNLDADPLFLDPSAGDFTLTPASPCRDAGDPALVTTRRDLFGRPRRLDGALVRSECVDMGAFEFGPLTLAVTGNATPGGTITIDSSGDVALVVFLIASLDFAELDHKFLGTFYVDFSSAWPLIPWSSPPSSIQVHLPSDFPAPLSIHLEEVGLLPANGAGATSNDVVVTVK